MEKTWRYRSHKGSYRSHKGQQQMQLMQQQQLQQQAGLLLRPAPGPGMHQWLVPVCFPLWFEHRHQPRLYIGIEGCINGGCEHQNEAIPPF